MIHTIQKHLLEAVAIKRELVQSEKFVSVIEHISSVVIQCFQGKGKLLLCGNGGSAADAQHIAAELSGRFRYDRPPLYAEALHVNTSYLTAVANDYGYEYVFERMVEAMGSDGDILIGMSASGNSTNVINALEAAKRKKMITIGMVGSDSVNMISHCDILFSVPSNQTARIQECHLLVGHIVCDIVETTLFPQEK